MLSGDYPAARARHEEALRLAQRLNLQWDIAFIRNGMGLCARRQGDYHLARAHHEHALSIYQRRRAELGVTLTHAWLGYTAELEGDADQAEAHHLESLDVETICRLRPAGLRRRLQQQRHLSRHRRQNPARIGSGDDRLRQGRALRQDDGSLRRRRRQRDDAPTS